ncbi:MAG: hypothetical protein SF069_00480 [Phycisphaerae bacterium]|nr:hypothetical protein [Phycisphaerae bacterium]
MWSFNALCDEFLVSSRLFFKLELMPSRESALHFFEQVRKRYPTMTRFRRREDGGLVLEDKAEVEGASRVLRMGPDSLRFGTYAAESAEDVTQYANTVLKLAPTALTFSELDIDQIEVVLTFDLEYEGNHDELVANTLFPNHPLFAGPREFGERIIECQPAIGFTVSEDCATQAYVDVKSRTNTFEVRSGEYERTPISVHVSLRRYWDGEKLEDLTRVHAELLKHAEEIAMQRVVPGIVQPLAAAIASRH